MDNRKSIQNTQTMLKTEIALSPISEKVLSTLIDIISSSEQQASPLVEDDLTVTVTNGKSMLITGVGAGAYLLADHTDTQGLNLPELWLGIKPLPQTEHVSSALTNLEERRVPGPEYGLWRLLSAGRAIAYHSLLVKTLDWALKHEEPKTTRCYNTRNRSTENIYL